PDTPQTARFTARVRSGDGQTAVRELSLTVTSDGAGGLAVRTLLLPPAIVGLRYGPQLRASGSRGGAVSWSLESGVLPPGVRLNADGTLTGVPTAAGAFTFGVRALAGAESATAAFTVRVDPNDTGGFDLTR